MRAWLVIVVLATVPLAVYGSKIEQWWRTPKPVARQTYSLFTPVTRLTVILEEDESLLGIDLDEPRPMPMLTMVPHSQQRRPGKSVHVVPEIIIHEESEEKLSIDLGP